MELIVITGERFGQDSCPEGLHLGGSEQKLVEEMFRTGLQRLHLRKP